MGFVFLRIFSLLKIWNSDFLVSPLLVLRCVHNSPLAVEMSRLDSLSLYFLFQWGKECYILAFVFGQNDEINFLS